MSSTESHDEIIHTNPSAIDQEKAAPETSHIEPAPDGGAQAWLVAAGAACIFFSCLGFSNSFGTLTEYYLSHQLRGQSPDNVAWIGSLPVFLQFFSGMVGGPLFDRFGVKVVRPAVLVYVFAMMMLSLCKSYWHFMVVQGVLMGLVMGFMQLPAIAAVSQYFDKKRAAALGIAISGSSIGGIIIPIALSKMLNSSSLDFGWSVRVIGFLIMPFMGFSLLTLKSRLPPRQTAFWMPEAFKDRRYVLLIVSMFFVFTGMFAPVIFISTYAVSRGMDVTLAGYLPAILNATSTFGRIIPGILADKYGRFNMYAGGSIITGVIIFCMDSPKSNAAIIAYTAVFGFSSGTIISGATVSLTACVEDPRNIGTYSGMGMALGALGSLIGPPVSGVFLKHYGGFFEAAMFSGALCLFGGIIGLMTKLATPQGLFGRV
ncbi:Aspyridones efflux protein apdF [Cladobotryum mycophilum]|uniref:Aspyridones efflux protein apdF n=1 Tax=Cladobotryum mycophilum TaxID=491253 RepID=A0ABR0SNU1_9HYPO